MKKNKVASKREIMPELGKGNPSDKGTLRQEIKVPVIAAAPLEGAGEISAAGEPLNISSESSFLIVGIGASAGGLAAFEDFFSGMPADREPGMAFVLVQHLAPDHKSLLAELIRRYTRMQVFEVEDGMKVLPNCTYIIPPNRDMAFFNGSLQLLEPALQRGIRLPIDFFFRSLAQDQHERAIGIVLSGTGSDGTLGIRAIKGEGGMVMAQNPASTEHDGMPRSAIATGLVDYELPPKEMAAQLLAYAVHACGKPCKPGVVLLPEAQSTLKKIFVLLRNHTGHDLSLYKPSTINRRIERRMIVQKIDSIDGYLKFLQQTPAEIDVLFQDFLIGVTGFFRDPEAFAFIAEHVIPRLFDGKPAGEVVRIWSSGCSSGEEACSLAMLITEHQEKLKQRFTTLIFASDIDARAVAAARTGLYSVNSVADVSPERLARFFTLMPDGANYRIHKTIRDMIVFSEQDVIKDPPFARLDLVCCRNMMIYMNIELQRKILPLFHYALNPGGVLFLGASETPGEHNDLFAVLNRRWKVYQRLDDHRAVYAERFKSLAGIGRFSSPAAAIAGEFPRADRSARTAFPGRPPMRELAERVLLQQVVLFGALINAHGDILYLHGRTGMYLELASGEIGISNILKMAREGLKHELSNALHRAVKNKELVRCERLDRKSVV